MVDTALTGEGGKAKKKLQENFQKARARARARFYRRSGQPISCRFLDKFKESRSHIESQLRKLSRQYILSKFKRS